MYIRMNLRDEVQKLEKCVACDLEPCTVCKSMLFPMVANDYLRLVAEEDRLRKENERLERRRKRAKRLGNLIMFPHPAR